MLPRPKLLRSPVSWAGMRFRDRVAHQDAIRGKVPKGTAGEALLAKQGEACSTCKDRRTRFRKDAGRLLKKRMKDYRAAAAKAAGSHYARKVFEREKLVRADRPSKDELRVPRAKKAAGKEEEKEEEEGSEERFSVEPEDREEESDFDEDPPDEGEDKEAKEKKEEKKEPKRAKSEEREETPREAREAIAITGSTSTAMQRMLARGLEETNRVNLTVVGKKLEIRFNKLKTEMLTDEETADLEKEIEAFEAEQERLLEERERLQAQRTTVVREEPKGRNDQGVHDSRYKRAVAGGTSHWKAWKEEKGRRRAQEYRKSGVGERARERIKADRRWHARHDRKLKDSDFVDNQQEDADIDTEVIDAEGNEAQAEPRREFRPLTRAERNSDRVDADDEEELYEKERERKERPKADGRYSADPDVAAEQRKKRNQKRNARRNALKRKLGSEWDPGHKKRNKRQRHQEEDEEEDADYDDHRDPRGDDPEDPDESGEGAVHQSVHSFETVVEAASLSASPGAAAVAAVEVNFDTGAAVTVLPEKYVTQPKDNGVRYKTASGEALRDQGKAEVTGILPGGRGATITGRGAGVHRVLLSGAQACKTHFAFLRGTGGLLVPKGSAFAKEADELLRKLAWKHKGVATKMQVKNGIYVFPLEDGKKGGLKGEGRGQDGLGFTGQP